MVEIIAARSGRPALVRLEPGDKGPVERMFHRLSAESLYRRFFSPVVRPDQFMRLMLRTDALEHVAVAAVQTGEVIAIAQYSRPEGARAADLAILVADAWQRQGIGTRLVAALADRARRSGIEAFCVDVQGDNYAVHRLLRRVAPGMKLSFSGGVGHGNFSTELAS